MRTSGHRRDKPEALRGQHKHEFEGGVMTQNTKLAYYQFLHSNGLISAQDVRIETSFMTSPKAGGMARVVLRFAPLGNQILCKPSFSLLLDEFAAPGISEKKWDALAKKVERMPGYIPMRWGEPDLSRDRRFAPHREMAKQLLAGNVEIFIRPGLDNADIDIGFDPEADKLLRDLLGKSAAPGPASAEEIRKWAEMRVEDAARPYLSTPLMGPDGQLDARGPDGGAALTDCVKNGSVEVLERLIAAGADVNYIHSEGGRPKTLPLHEAIMGKRVDMVRCLLAHHADPMLHAGNLRSPMALAENEAEFQFDGENADLNEIVSLIRERCADPESLEVLSP